MIVGLIGRRRVGKDTAAAALIEDGFFPIKFADGLKIMLRALLKSLDYSDRVVARMIDGDLKEELIPTLGERSPRFLMQTLGTQWGRDIVAEDVWVRIAIDRCLQVPNAVVTDCRFPNEAEAIRAAGGVLVRIERKAEQWCGAYDTHPSEVLTDELQADYSVINDGSVSDLHGKVRQVLRMFRAGTLPVHSIV